MSRISEHLDARPFQVAISTDRALPLRKWDHRGTIHAPSSRSAAYLAGVAGDIIAEHVTADGIAYEFPGHFVHVGFGAQS